MNFRNWLEATEPYRKQGFEPALMTWEEFYAKVNPDGKYHDTSAYNWGLSHFKKTREEYPELLFRKKLRGVSIEFRAKREERYEGQYVKDRDDHGQLTYYSKEEIADFVKYRYEHSFAAFDGEQQVGLAQDEWGCVLVSVAREYQGFGIGDILSRLAYDAEPGKNTGGCTPAGFQMMFRTYQSYVREYLRKGFYSQLVRNGELDQTRVKAILASAKLQDIPKRREQFNLNADDPNDFLLYGADGCFILYNRRLKDFLDENPLDEERRSHWEDRFIKGTSFAGGGYVMDDKLYLHQLGGDNPNFKKFMLSLALSFAAREKLPLHVYDRDLQFAASIGKVQGNLVMLNGPPIQYDGMIRQEAIWRRTFDRYGEFHARLMELAEVKHR